MSKMNLTSKVEVKSNVEVTSDMMKAEVAENTVVNGSMGA